MHFLKDRSLTCLKKDESGQEDLTTLYFDTRYDNTFRWFKVVADTVVVYPGGKLGLVHLHQLHEPISEIRSRHGTEISRIGPPLNDSFFSKDLPSVNQLDSKEDSSIKMSE